MAWKTGRNSALGLPSVNPLVADQYPIVPLGTVAWFYEDTLGPVELIYLPGLGSTGVDSALIDYTMYPVPTIFRHAGSSPVTYGRPLAVTITAFNSSAYGWHQISGLAIVQALAAAPGPAFATASIGIISSTPLAGSQILNARIESALNTPLPGRCYMLMNRPFAQGQIT